MFMKKLIWLWIIVFFANACKQKTNASTDTVINSSKSKTNANPDPNIEVKDNFEQLTKDDEEKEDKSHMDMSYFPSNYALNKALNANTDLKIRIIYSRPHKSNRLKIFGTDSTLLVPYGKLWRLGANESTEIEFLKPVEIEGNKINPGRYAVYAIPQEKTWSLLFNKDLYTFGAFNYNPQNNIAKGTASVTKGKFSLETFHIYFQKTNEGCNMICSWDDVVASLPIKFL